MVCEARRVARLVERTRTPVYFYSFEREADAVVPDLVIHGLDRNFVYGNNFGPPSNYVLNADDLALFGAISGYWTRFAASGNPNGADGIDDIDLTIATMTAMVITVPVTTALSTGPPSSTAGRQEPANTSSWMFRFARSKRLREEQCDFWEPFFLRSIANGSVPASSPSNDLCGVNDLSRT